MLQFLVILTPNRESFKTQPTETERSLVADHFAYFSQAYESGTLLLAGRTHGKEHGIAILIQHSLAEAQAFLNEDPAIRGGLFRAELYPFALALGEDRFMAGEK